jgi:hypothetical protein
MITPQEIDKIIIALSELKKEIEIKETDDIPLFQKTRNALVDYRLKKLTERVTFIEDKLARLLS